MTIQTEPKTTTPTARLLVSADDLRNLGISYSKAQLYKMIATGGFPKPVKISTQRSAFILREIEAWLEARMAERDGGAAA